MQLLFSRRDAAASLSISLRQLDYLIEQGHLKPTRIGRSVKIHTKDLEKFAGSDRPVL